MNITVKKMDGQLDETAMTGGEFGILNLEVYVDGGLSPILQQERVIHSVTENYFCSISHEKVDEFVELVMEALIQLDETA